MSLTKLVPLSKSGCAASLVVQPTVIAFHGRNIFIYCRNMGVAQDLDAFVELAVRLRHRADIGFLLIGRGSEVSRLRGVAQKRGLDNLRIDDQVSPVELAGLIAHCHAGIVALHPGHGTHNIPGKLLTYLQAGLPVLARVNPGNDLHRLVLDEGIGASVVGKSLDALVEAATWLADCPGAREQMGSRGRALSDRLFSPAAAAEQVVRGLTAR